MTRIPDISSQGLPQQGTAFTGRSARTGVNSYESMDAGLTIKTREGDIVTLSSSQYSEFSANEYTSQGEVRTPEGSARLSTHTREITLSSGEAFSFSVQGDLNEQELADIAAIVQGVDGIISEMVQGDMDAAVANALNMGPYDSVSMYAADISVTKGYAAYTETQAASSGPLTAGIGRELDDDPGQPRSFMDRVAQLMDAQEERALAMVRQPLSQLFDHYLENSEADAPGNGNEYQALADAGKGIQEMLNKMVEQAFGNTLNRMV